MVVAIPVVDAAILDGFLSPNAVYLAVAAVALVVAADVLTFTPARMNRPFAVAFVVIATLAVGATWNVALWVADATFGTAYLLGDRTQDAANRAMMVDFLYATGAGLLAGVLFIGYLRRRPFAPTASTGVAEEPDPKPSFSRDRFDLPEGHLRWLSWAMQFALGDSSSTGSSSATSRRSPTRASPS